MPTTTTSVRNAIAAILPLCISAAPATLVSAQESVFVGIEATASFWWTIHEQVQNGLFQPGSGDVADDHASGFSFRHGRLGLSFESPREHLQLLLRLRLEERADIADFYAGWTPTPGLRLYFGQMKIPSTAEVLTPYHELDFAARSTFGKRVGDYSLTRTPYISSLMAAKSYHRDLGLAWKGSLVGEGGRGIHWFAMAGNGLGANRYIGGGESEEFLFTNSIGELYYGARLEFVPDRRVAAGLHASRNNHRDVALSDRGPVFDIGRSVWTADLAVSMDKGWRGYAFYGRGDMDDYFDSQQYDYTYSGWGVQLVAPVRPQKLEIALRYDRFSSELVDDGIRTTQHNWTGGVNFKPRNNVWIQLNYVTKRTENQFEEDLGDNLLLINCRVFFDSVVEL